MFRWRAAPMLLALIVLALACGASALVAALPMLPFQLRAARARWQTQRPSHYALTVRWNDTMGEPRHLRAELRGSQLIAATDLTDGTAADPAQLGRDARFLSVDYLLDTIERQQRPHADPLTELARLHPRLARWLGRCVTPRPAAEYDPTYGFPRQVRFYADSCEGRLAFRTAPRIIIERLEVLE